MRATHKQFRLKKENDQEEIRTINRLNIILRCALHMHGFKEIVISHLVLHASWNVPIDWVSSAIHVASPSVLLQ